MKTTIIIPCKDNLQYTIVCIKSIKRNTISPYKIIIVDDGSVATNYTALRKIDRITLLTTQKKSGFPAACNLGMSKVESEFFVIINNDVEVTNGWLTDLLNHMRQNPKLGILGPVTNRVSGPQQDCCACYTTREGMERHAIAVNNRKPARIEFYPRVVFFCVLIRTELYKQIGGLDENFGLGNFEDDDYCLRTKFAGWQTAIDYNVFIHHYRSKTFGKMGQAYIDILQKNKDYFIKKWGRVKPQKGPKT